MKDIKISSERISIRPRSFAEMQAYRDNETDPEEKKAYSEMIETMEKLPGREEWAADWVIELPDGSDVGGVGFKGVPDSTGSVDLGYGIKAEYRRNGYATEAVALILAWAFEQPGVKRVTAQTDPENMISQKVLAKNGFVRDGDGDEGPMFVCSFKSISE